MKRNLFRRALACLCLCAVLSGGLCVPARAVGFRDVPAGHWAADAIDFASSRELFNLDNVIMTPHMAATTEQSVLNCCTSVANDIVAVCNGQEPKVKAQKPKF